MRRQMMLAGLTLAAGGLALSWGGPARADDKKEPAAEAERFDLLVREDIFAGFAGDAAALERGVKLCDEKLAKEPKHPEALVWRGATRVFRSGAEFRKQNTLLGMSLWSSGLKDMDDAVALAPDSVGVRIPRAATLINAARNAPPAMGKPLFAKVRGDYEAILEKQKGVLAELGTHPRGELRMGLADIYRMTAEPEKSKEQLEAVAKELPNTKYAARAKEWLAAKPDAKLAHNCIGCHSK